VILLVSPAAPTTLHGNGVTADRWAGILRRLGHEVDIADAYRAGDYTALVALHARKSADAVRSFRADHPEAPIVLALTGTDLYPDLATAGVDPAVVARADRLIVLQGNGLQQVDPQIRWRARVIFQGVPDIPSGPFDEDHFDVCVLAHLRAVKDPLLAAAAARRLPTESRIRIIHAGQGLDDDLTALAQTETADNPHYTWVGPLPRSEALALLARSRLLVLSSRHEGGANVVSEALAAGVPAACSDIPGSVGMLGADYPGYFPVGNAEALATLLRAAETNHAGYYDQLRRHCASRRSLVDPAQEVQAWSDLLKELSLPVPA
jgi:putative glycosyltransferase (TIGR04348 family)